MSRLSLAFLLVSLVVVLAEKPKPTVDVDANGNPLFHILPLNEYANNPRRFGAPAPRPGRPMFPRPPRRRPNPRDKTPEDPAEPQMSQKPDPLPSVEPTDPIPPNDPMNPVNPPETVIPLPPSEPTPPMPPSDPMPPNPPMPPKVPPPFSHHHHHHHGPHHHGNGLSVLTSSDFWEHFSGTAKGLEKLFEGAPRPESVNGFDVLLDSKFWHNLHKTAKGLNHLFQNQQIENILHMASNWLRSHQIGGFPPFTSTASPPVYPNAP